MRRAHEERERGAQQVTLSRGGERDARGGEEPNGGATQFWGEVDAGVREWRGATSSGGTINSDYSLLVTSTLSSNVFS